TTAPRPAPFCQMPSSARPPAFTYTGTICSFHAIAAQGSRDGGGLALGLEQRVRGGRRQGELARERFRRVGGAGVEELAQQLAGAARLPRLAAEARAQVAREVRAQARAAQEVERLEPGPALGEHRELRPRAADSALGELGIELAEPARRGAGRE